MPEHGTQGAPVRTATGHKIGQLYWSTEYRRPYLVIGERVVWQYAPPYAVKLWADAANPSVAGNIAISRCELDPEKDIEIDAPSGLWDRHTFEISNVVAPR